MLAYYAIPLYITLMALEIGWSSWKQTQTYEVKDTAASLAMGVGNVALGLLLAGASYGILELAYQHRLFDLEWHWWVWALLFLGEDFCYYWFHRFGHETRVMWAGHVNHHSSRRYNLATALRQPWTTMLPALLFWWPLALIGFPPEMILLQQSVSLIYQFWIHTEFISRLGPLEWVLNTPSHHRVHHASDLKYLDANYGGIFIIWDRLFGTFIAEEEAPTYGLLEDIDTYNPIRIAFHEWVDLIGDAAQPGLTLSQRLRYVFGRPGWSHDGSKLTVPQLRAQAAEEDAPGSLPEPPPTAEPAPEPAAGE